MLGFEASIWVRFCVQNSEHYTYSVTKMACLSQMNSAVGLFADLEVIFPVENAQSSNQMGNQLTPNDCEDSLHSGQKTEGSVNIIPPMH